MLCDYGCGQEAKFQLKNGKWCCCDDWHSCSEVKNKCISIYKNIKKCDKCGKNIYTAHIKKHQSFCLVNNCLECGKLINSNKKFCNSSCSATYNNKHSEKLKNCKRGPNQNTKQLDLTYVFDKENKKYLCMFCGKNLNRKKHFCNLSCFHDYQQKEKIDRWLSGQLTGTMCNGEYSKFIKRYILKINNYKCQICGWDKINPTSGTCPLEIHHIDGDFSNNTLYNIQLLCPNCHSLTSTYKNHNQGMGRERRRKQQ